MEKVNQTTVQSFFSLKMLKCFSYEHIKTHLGHSSVFTLGLFCSIFELN